MYHTDSAVSLMGVTKTFTQWQRETTGKSLIRNLFKPEKRVITALEDVSFHVRRGEFVAYAGPNGAGKSTTMRLLSGMLVPNCGEITVLGEDVQKKRQALMKKIGILFGNRTELWWDHPIMQSFEWKKVVWDIPKETYDENLEMVIELLSLKPLLKTFARELSLGQRMRADLAMLLLHSPELILLDEPTLGLDVVAKRQMIDFLKKINGEKNVTIIVTSHDMDDLEEMAQRILMISSGKIAYDGNFDGLRQTTGSLTRVTVTTDNGSMPSLPGATLLSGNAGVFEFEMDVLKTPIREMMGFLAKSDGVLDVEIKKAPIEQVIARLYESWK